MIKVNGITTGKFVNAIADVSVQFLNGIENVQNINCLVVANVGYAAQSADNGVNWTQISGILATDDLLDCDMSNDGKYRIITTSVSGKIYLSTDFGVTYTSTSVPNIGYIKVKISATGQYMILCTNSGQGICKSSNYGVTWTYQTIDYVNYFNNIMMDSTGQYLVLTGSSVIKKSIDYGATWTSTIAQPFASVQATDFVISGDNSLYFAVNNASQAGLVPRYSTNGGVSWNNAQGGLAEAAAFSISCSYDGKYILIGKNAATCIVSSNYGVSWSYISSVLSSVFYCNGMSNNGKIMLLGGASNKMCLSNNYGVSFFEITALGNRYWNGACAK